MSGKNDTIEILSSSPSVIQAVYHAATGKTENITKYISKNYVVRKPDIDQLYYKLKQQIDLCETVAQPTVTVKSSFSNNESQLFSSWERFNLFDSGRAELIDDIILKIEFIIKVPQTNVIQRCVVNVDIDSRLPMVDAKSVDIMGFEFTMITLYNIPPISVSVDLLTMYMLRTFARPLKNGQAD